MRAPAASRPSAATSRWLSLRRRAERLEGIFRHRGELLGLMFGHQRACEFADVAVHDGVHLVQREVDAVVGDPTLRKIVGADALGTVAAADQALALGGGLGILFAHLGV